MLRILVTIEVYAVVIGKAICSIVGIYRFVSGKTVRKPEVKTPEAQFTIVDFPDGERPPKTIP